MAYTRYGKALIRAGVQRIVRNAVIGIAKHTANGIGSVAKAGAGGMARHLGKSLNAGKMKEIKPPRKGR